MRKVDIICIYLINQTQSEQISINLMTWRHKGIFCKIIISEEEQYIWEMKNPLLEFRWVVYWFYDSFENIYYCFFNVFNELLIDSVSQLFPSHLLK